jgi:uncharacterized protein YhfF
MIPARISAVVERSIRPFSDGPPMCIHEHPLRTVAGNPMSAPLQEHSSAVIGTRRCKDVAGIETAKLPSTQFSELHKGNRTMIGKKTPLVEKFWQDCRKAHGIGTQDYHALSVADPRFATYLDELLDLLAAGKKRATAHMLLDFEKNNVPRRKVGDYWIILSAATNEPNCLVRITDVAVTPFNEVKVEFASREGEGDSSLKYWQDVHREYFELQCKNWGIAFREDTPVVCEGFDLIAMAPR